jgi:hypothetical protein
MVCCLKFDHAYLKIGLLLDIIKPRELVVNLRRATGSRGLVVNGRKCFLL